MAVFRLFIIFLLPLFFYGNGIIDTYNDLTYE
jgi:hypothetical protein